MTRSTLEPGSRWPSRLSLALIVLGAAVRIYHWLGNRSLWMDETFLAVNITQGHFGDLHHRLEYNQSAPYLFLVASKAVTAVLGPSELALRLIPLLAGLLALVLFWRLTRACLEDWIVPVAVAAFALAYQPVYFSQEAKQYSVEILFAILVTWLAARMWKQQAAPERPFLAVVLAGCIGMFAMHTMPFVLAGIGLGALWAIRAGVLKLSYRKLAVAIALWLALFAVNYAVFVRPNYDNFVMKHFWSFAYPGPPWTVPGLRSWFILMARFAGYIGYGGIFGILLAVLAVAGIWFAVRSRHYLVVGAALAMVSCWMAALAGTAPFADRLVVFLFPLVLLLAGSGLGSLTTGRPKLVGAIGAAALLVPTVLGLPRTMARIDVGNVRDAVVQLARVRQPADPIYLTYRAQAGFRYYRQVLGLAALQAPPIVLGSEKRRARPSPQAGMPAQFFHDTDLIIQELSTLREARRLWVLTVKLGEGERELLRMARQVLGLVPTQRFEWKDTRLFCFER